MKDLNIVWYVLCWNEMPILPFMVDYWKRIARKVVVYDNGSTDGSVEYLRGFDWIEVRPYPIATGGQLNDAINRDIKNGCWKECKGKGIDWVIVSDLDEILWAKDLEGLLTEAKEVGIVVPRPTGLDFVSDKFPEYDGRLLHKIVGKCVLELKWNKPIVFCPDMVDEIKYKVGCHSAAPTCKGEMQYVDGLYLLHFKYLSAEYLIGKRRASQPRMSAINLRKKWGYEYMWEDEKIREQWREKWENSVEYEG